MPPTPQPSAFEPVRRQRPGPLPANTPTTDTSPATTRTPAANTTAANTSGTSVSGTGVAAVAPPAAPSSLPEVVPVEPASRPRQRDPFFDNAKYFAILLVVAGHVLNNLRGYRFAHALYLFVYTFHMPLF